MNRRTEARVKRQHRIRKRIRGTTERPRLSVFRSAKHIYAQVIDDTTGRTLAYASSVEKELRSSDAGKVKKAEIAKTVGELVAKRCVEKEIKLVTFDRNGFIYHGRVAKLAEGARASGLEF